MAVTALTTEEIRTLRDYIPALSDRTPGMDLATTVGSIITQANSNETAVATVSAGIVSGSAVIASGAATVIVGSAGNDGKPVVAMLAEDDGVAANHVLRVVWDGSDNLTITVSNNVTDDRTVFYIIDGR